MINKLNNYSDCQLEDAGVYQLEAESKMGKANAPVHMVVQDKPGPPQGPVRVEFVKADTVFLEWQEPDQLFGSELISYVVEKQEVSSLVSCI